MPACVSRCRDRSCRTEMTPSTQSPRTDRTHNGRGLCQRCWRRHAKAGTLDRFAIERRPYREVYEEYLVLKARKYTIREAADVLGMKYEALERAICRARAALRAEGAA